MNLSDLSPEALTKLEACLLEDVQVVRRMRTLMEEYRHRLAPPVAAPPGPAAAPAVPVAPAPPRKSYEEVLFDALLEMPATGFRFGDIRTRLRKGGYNPDDSGLKTWMNRMIREGKAAVQKKQSGRGGSIYRCTIASPPPAESTPPAPESGPPPPVSGPQASDS